MDFDNPKVYGDTFISDGLVVLQRLFHLIPWRVLLSIYSFTWTTMIETEIGSKFEVNILCTWGFHNHDNHDKEQSQQNTTKIGH